MRHGLSTDDTCALCDQESESIAHLMIQCSFSQQIWFNVCSLNITTCIPGRDDDFNSCFETAVANAPPDTQSGAKLIMILAMWRIWKTRNDVVFNNVAPRRHDLVLSIMAEAKLWLLAGARALRQLPLHTRPPDDNLPQHLQA
jgi:hypothetical protein